jgi:hypothetical protein
MKGDFSRIRFIPAKHYTAVLEQQGRVSLDADTNEQAAIDDYLSRSEIVDVIGQYGAPEHDAGFAISVQQNEILIGPGRYYVQGLVCENCTDKLPYVGQPYLLNPYPTDATLLAELAQAGGSSAIQVYLQVWQRLVTALDDPCLREPALGQADTTARLQTVWRVVASVVPPPPPSPVSRRPLRTIFGGTLLEARQNLAETLRENATFATTKLNVARSPIEVSGTSKLPTILRATPIATATGTNPAPAPAPSAPVDCCTAMYANTPAASTGTMSASTAPAGSSCSCQPIPAAGYQGLENQLYRVEIHRPGNELTATLKWSRENASVVASIQHVQGNTIRVDSLGPDANLGFSANQWVEISDDTDLFGETPNAAGLLYHIHSVDPTIPSITLTAPVVAVDSGRNARVRRWDQVGPSATNSGVPLPVDSWLTLENGIQVSFRPGTYQAGDYWTIPARTASGLIDWPPCGSNGELFQPPQSLIVYNAPLACIHWDPKRQQPVPQDCRRFFSPLTELTAPAASKALHVTSTNWTSDALITADVWVANGLSVTLDGAPTSPITNAEFVVTIESIFDPFPSFTRLPVSVDRQAINVLPSTFLRTHFAIDSTITVTGPTIAWTLPYVKAPLLQVLTINAINSGLLFGASLGQYARVRVRLLGNTISSGTGETQLFLDGQSRGEPTTDADGTARMDLQLPTGTGKPWSDFESWFYVAPTLLIANLSVAYPALYAIVFNDAVTAVSNAPPDPATGATGPKVDPFVTVTTNYRALADTEITLALLDPGGAPSKNATIESPITIHRGELSANAAITVTGNPLINAVPTTVTITVEASIATAIGLLPATPVTFTLTGGFSQQIIN